MSRALLAALVLLPAIAVANDAHHSADTSMSTVPAATPDSADQPQLRRVHFDNEEVQLDTADLNDLEYNAMILRDNPDFDVVLIGHADAPGSTRLNEKLSEQRAKTVADYLRSVGIDDDRLVVLSAGEGYPRVDTLASTPENRRVEFLIDDDDATVSGTIDSDYIDPLF